MPVRSHKSVRSPRWCDFYLFALVGVAASAEVVFEIQDAELRTALAETHHKQMGQVHHQEGKTDRISEQGLVDIHKILKAPERLGIAEIELNLEAKLVGVKQLVKSECKVAAVAKHMRLALRRPIGFDQDNNGKAISKRLVQQRGLIDIGLNPVFRKTLHQRLRRHLVNIELVL